MIEEFDRKAVERLVAARLVAGGKLDEAALDRVLRLQASNAERLEALLVKLGLASERDVADALSRELRLEIAEAPDYPEAPIAEGKLTSKFMRHAGVLPLADRDDGLVVAMIDPLDAYAARAVEMAIGKRLLRRIALPSDFDTAYARLYEAEQPAMGQVASAGEIGSDDELLEDVDRLRDLASEVPVIRLVNQLITRAVENRASDIHIEPLQNRMAVRYRIDGALREFASPPTRLRAAIISRVKIMAKLNIAERRLPQDGRIRLAVQGREFDLRVSTMPCLHGESVVMRILDRSSLVEDLGALGFEAATLEPFLKVLDHPQGILLVTGPTGSGKTTTLYTCLMRLNAPERKLFTVEDPIEYQLEGVNQIQVKPQIGLTFAQVLRSVLRQDPDVIMVGEMRDLETAQIAVQAALTGHLVLSTLHTNNAAGTVTRLLDMGVEDYLVTSTVNGVLAQRLVRKLCPHCREAYRALPELAAHLRLPARAAEPVLYRARGCERCQGSGYFGRIAVLEFLPLSDEIRRLVLNRATAQEIHRAAAAQGMRSMYEDGLEKALRGITSIEEVLRVTRDV
ncbi:MAG TPA: type II secretion system ATPase GspE [Stellaceae bacterium]|nr:type II secretion system ATPase GspE [Stellaceae bacterium]